MNDILLRVWRIIWRNLGTFLLASTLAVTVWVSAVIADDPNEERALNNISLQVTGQNEDYILIGDLPSTVSVRLEAPLSLWNRLQTESSLVRAELDLSGLEPGEYTLPIDIVLNINPVRVVQRTPAEVTIQLERLVREDMFVHTNITGEPALGFQADVFTLSQNQVMLSGPESVIDLVASVQADLDISGARQNITEEVQLVALDDLGQVISGVTMEPAKVTIFQTVLQSGGYRDVAVKVETTGQLANGYRVTNVSVSPPTVTIFSSDPELVAQMPGFVSTQPLDLTEADDDIETRLTLDLPEGVELVSEEQSVQVQVGIAAIETSIQISIPVQTFGLSAGLAASVSPDSVDLILSGPLPVLENLVAEDLIVSVDLTDLGVGNHLVEPHSEILLDDVVIQSISPPTLEVAITVAISPTFDPNATPTLTPTTTPTMTATSRPTTLPTATPRASATATP